MDIQEISERIHTLEKELAKLHELKLSLQPHVIHTTVSFVWDPSKPDQITVNDGTKNVDLYNFTALVRYLESYPENPFDDFVNGLLKNE